MRARPTAKNLGIALQPALSTCPRGETLSDDPQIGLGVGVPGHGWRAYGLMGQHRGASGV
jgi:hypothetical protein